ncbi:MAG: glutathione S-transferase family protein [Betaproteobacteria bacterium]|nr:glutathione S-transferase family protein [Betaproteobacteria bacterium]
MLKIWGRKNSVNVQKVLWCCEEIGIEYQRIDAGGDFGIVQTPHYLSLNPNALVPTIEDEGLVLWESHAIVRYLAAKNKARGLWPNDLKTCAKADQWMDWSSSTFWPALRPLFMGLIRTPANQRDPQALKEHRLKTAEVLAIADSHLESRAFLAGDNFTVSDIALGCGVWRWMALPIERPLLPHVQRWFDCLAQRPAYQKVVMLPLT